MVRNNSTTVNTTKLNTMNEMNHKKFSYSGMLFLHLPITMIEHKYEL